MSNTRNLFESFQNNLNEYDEEDEIFDNVHEDNYKFGDVNYKLPSGKYIHFHNETNGEGYYYAIYENGKEIDGGILLYSEIDAKPQTERDILKRLAELSGLPEIAEATEKVDQEVIDSFDESALNEETKTFKERFKEWLDNNVKLQDYDFTAYINDLTTQWGETGNTRYELSKFKSKSGNPEIFDFDEEDLKELGYNFDELDDEEVKEYRYITNHGIGPGTLPEGVFVRAEPLPFFKTAIYTNRPLTDEELKKYDIKPEWIQESALSDKEMSVQDIVDWIEKTGHKKMYNEYANKEENKGKPIPVLLYGFYEWVNSPEAPMVGDLDWFDENINEEDKEMKLEEAYGDDYKDLPEFHSAFQITRNIIFFVSYYRLGNNKYQDFSTSVDELMRNKRDISSGGQAQDRLLPQGSLAKEFYEKWDHKHLHYMTEEEYNEMRSDLDKLKNAYNYIEQENDIRFSQEVELSKEPLKKIKESAKPLTTKGLMESLHSIKEDWEDYEDDDYEDEEDIYTKAENWDGNMATDELEDYEWREILDNAPEVYKQALRAREEYVKDSWGEIPELVWNEIDSLIDEGAFGNPDNVSPEFIVDNIIINGDYGDFDNYKEDNETDEEFISRVEDEVLEIFPDERFVIFSL